MTVLEMGVDSWKLKMVYWTLQTIAHELRSMGPKFIPLLVTRCLYLGASWGWWGLGIHLTKYQPEPQADQMSCWPAVVTLLTTRCMYWQWGIKGWQGCRGCRRLHMKNEDGLLQILLKTQDGLLKTIEHELRWMGPKLVLLLVTRCLY